MSKILFPNFLLLNFFLKLYHYTFQIMLIIKGGGGGGGGKVDFIWDNDFWDISWPKYPIYSMYRGNFFQNFWTSAPNGLCATPMP